MPSMSDILKFLLLIAVALVVGFLSTTKKGNRVLNYIVGGMLVFIGATGLASGKIQQQWQAGPPLDGPLAIVGSAAILAVGLYIVYLMVSGKSENQRPKK
jgi:hypothetical protein